MGNTKKHELLGRRFGRLLVTADTMTTDRNHNHLWICRCDCGNTKTVASPHLVRGKSKSCGCYRVEFTTRKSTRHGMSKSPEYEAWLGIKRRCSNQTRKDWPAYGGRGIQVCERWAASFENFISDIGPRPGSNYSIDRINNDGNYEPGNCRWATSIEQCQNRRIRKDSIVNQNQETRKR